MKINNKTVEDLEGIFVSFLPASSDFVSNAIIGNESHIDSGLEVKTQTRNLVIVFEKEAQMSRFSAEVINKFNIEFEGFIYDCLLTNTPSLVHIGRGIVEVTYQMSAVCKKPMISISESYFDVEGTYQAECIYELTSSEDIDTFSVDGYEVKNLKANKKFIIDGINKLVYYEESPNLSEFDNVNLTTFPKLEVGHHEITKSNNNVQVIVSYYPTYL